MTSRMENVVVLSFYSGRAQLLSVPAFIFPLKCLQETSSSCSACGPAISCLTSKGVIVPRGAKLVFTEGWPSNLLIFISVLLVCNQGERKDWVPGVPQIHPSPSCAPLLIVRNYISRTSLPLTLGGMPREAWWKTGGRGGNSLLLYSLPLLLHLSSGCVPFKAPAAATQPLPYGPSSHGAISQFQYLQETWFWPLVPPSAPTVSRALVCLWLPAVANLCCSTVSC